MSLKTTDRQIFELIEAEKARQSQTINLIPSENYTSPAVLQALGSVLTNKYSEGYPGMRYYSGNQFVDKIEEIEQKNCSKLNMLMSNLILAHQQTWQFTLPF
ncbi:MAG: serine hydroxymethyltransferase [Microgenomates group bacterium LiPW_16]|nr:MAG: serine hydroxymethyltransferase [Microgenomates group bacterium LiPW_16]